MKSKTRKDMFQLLYIFGVSLTIASGLFGFVLIGLAAGPLGALVGLIGGAMLWIFPTMDFYERYKKAEQEEENQPYRFR